MRNGRYVIAALAGALLLAGCGGSGAGAAGVPSLTQTGQAGGQPASAGGSGPARAAALYAAAACIRQHGIPSYADPVLTASGQVYSDSRSIQNAPQSVLSSVEQACGALAAQAGLNPLNEPPAPAQLVEAGVRSAECLRAHGLPNVQDPTAQTPYTPGHGFGMSRNEIPAGGKLDPAYQAAAHACRSLLDTEIRASTLASLGNDG